MSAICFNPLIYSLFSGRFEEIAREELLGKGSFGTVYRAVWRPPNQPARSELEGCSLFLLALFFQGGGNQVF